MTLDIDDTHSLPEEYIEKTREETQVAVGLYNELNKMGLPTFEKHFETTLDDIHTYAENHSDAELLFFVLGVQVATEELLQAGELIGNAETKFVFELGDTNFIDTYHYMADTIDDSDYFLLITLQPSNCPPGSNHAATDLPLDTYHDIVTGLLYQRIDLFQNDIDRYKRVILTPIVTALEAHPDTTQQ